MDIPVQTLDCMQLAELMGKALAPVATAPKSFVDDRGIVHGVYLLMWEPGDPAFGMGGFDDDPQTGFVVGWWEPNEHNHEGGRGCWYNGHHPIHPTHWLPLPLAPQQVPIQPGRLHTATVAQLRG